MKKSSIILIIALIAIIYGIFSGAFIEVYAMVIKPKYAGTASPYDDIIQKYSEQYDIDPVLIRAIIRQESNWQPYVIGFDGLSIGLMQITKPLAQDFFGVNYKPDFESFSSPDINIHIGAWFLRKLINHFGYDLNKVLDAYNMGMGNVDKGKDSSYSDKVLSWYQAYRTV